MDEPRQVVVNVGGREVPLVVDQVQALIGLTEQEGWTDFRLILKTMCGGIVEGLSDPGTPLETIRELQGRLKVAADIVDLFDEALPQWLDSMSKETTNG